MNLGLIKGMVMASFRHPLPLHWSLMASPMRIMTARTAMRPRTHTFWSPLETGQVRAKQRGLYPWADQWPRTELTGDELAQKPAQHAAETARLNRIGFSPLSRGCGANSAGINILTGRSLGFLVLSPGGASTSRLSDREAKPRQLNPLSGSIPLWLLELVHPCAVLLPDQYFQWRVRVVLVPLSSVVC